MVLVQLLLLTLPLLKLTFHADAEDQAAASPYTCDQAAQPGCG